MGEKREDGRAGASARAAKGRWNEVVLVCGKCGKRQGIGRGGLRKRLKRAAKEAGPGRRLRVAEVGCLGICPGKGIVAATGSALSAGRLVILPPDVDGADALRALLPGEGA